MQIVPPTACPNCGSALELVTDDLFCRNPQCEAQAHKKIEHFCKSMKIKGFGPATVKKLQLSSIRDLLVNCCDAEFLQDRLSCSEHMANKLAQEVKNSYHCDFGTFIGSLSIPLIGKSKGNDLAQHVNSVEDINEDVCKLAELGPKATTSLLGWIENTYKMEGFSELGLQFYAPKPKNEVAEKKGVVCISGKLTSRKTKAEAQKELEAAGYEVKSSLTKEVTILLNESGIESSKTKKALENNITIETKLENLLGGI